MRRYGVLPEELFKVAFSSYSYAFAVNMHTYLLKDDTYLVLRNSMFTDWYEEAVFDTLNNKRFEAFSFDQASEIKKFFNSYHHEQFTKKLENIINE